MIAYEPPPKAPAIVRQDSRPPRDLRSLLNSELDSRHPSPKQDFPKRRHHPHWTFPAAP